MNDRDSFGFPFLLTGSNEQAEMPHRQSDLEHYGRMQGAAVVASYNAAMSNANIDLIPGYWKTDAQRKLDRAKAIAAEVCARRFPVTKIPKEQQE
jgi:hypothetical protein